MKETYVHVDKNFMKMSDVAIERSILLRCIMLDSAVAFDAPLNSTSLNLWATVL